MTRRFHVVPASDSIKLDGEGKGEVSYTVTNAQTTSARRKAVVVPARGDQSWYAIEGDAERLFAGNETISYKVSIQVPQGTPEGSYRFRLNMVDPGNSDEDVTEGQSVSFQVGPAKEEKKPFRWWIAAVAAGVLVAIGAGVFFITSRGITVPELIGQTFAEASEWIEEHQLVLIEVQQVLEEESEVVLDQAPEAGTKLKKGAEVTLTRAMPFIEVPDLEGMKSAAALEQLTALTLGLGEVTELTGLLNDADTVVSQDPAPGARVRPTTAVALTVEAPVRAVPDLRGMDWSAAVAKLGEFGLKHESTFQAKDPSKAGKVVDQQPTPGLNVQKGATVKLTAEQGRIPTPAVTGLPLADARSKVEGVGLKAKVAAAALFPTGAAGTIGGQDPVQGSLLTEGATVTLIPIGKKVTVPRVVDESIQRATEILKQRGLTVAQTYRYTTETAAGRVMSQNPAKDSVVLEGSAVTCEVTTSTRTLLTFDKDVLATQTVFRKAVETKPQSTGIRPR